ncbi:hypothetical protein ABZX62_13535 [Streptomyces flavidovirens]|uniref:hypothetical protein n=1 Tax=Streptomyces flavidovirens TaxID=67298 RepID=UPI0033BEC7B9
MNIDETRLRLDYALDALAVAFQGMTAHPDERQCDCHWGSAEELTLLKTADVELDADLLNRTWQTTDWGHRAAVLRRVLPQFATALVSGSIHPVSPLGNAGSVFAAGEWQQWPAPQARAVWEFLHAWWAHTLNDAHPAVPAHEVLVVCTEAACTLTPWLSVWEQQRHPTANQHLAETLDVWEYDLLMDELPWRTGRDEDDAEKTRVELTTWMIRHAPARLRAQHASEHLLHAVRLLGLTGPDRWYDPHWSVPPYPA